MTEKQIGLYGRQVCELNRHVQQPPSLPTALHRVVPWGLLLRVERSSRTPNTMPCCAPLAASRRRIREKHSIHVSVSVCTAMCVRVRECVCACMRSRLYVCVLVECAYVCFAVLHRELTFSRHYEHHRPSIAAVVGH